MTERIDVVYVFANGRILIFDNKRRIMRTYSDKNAFKEPEILAKIVKMMPDGAYLKRYRE